MSRLRGVFSSTVDYFFVSQKNIPNYVVSENKVNFIFSQLLVWSGVPGSNWRPHVPQTCALPLRQPPNKNDHILYGQGDRTWTDGLSVPNAARYQLRHTQILHNYTINTAYYSAFTPINTKLPQLLSQGNCFTLFLHLPRLHHLFFAWQRI